MRHIGCVHAFDPGCCIICGVDGCQATYSNFASYKTHLYRKHRESELDPVCLERLPDVSDATNVELSGEELDIDETHINKETLRDSGAKFILKMKEGLCLSQRACDQMVSGVAELCSGLVAHLHKSVRAICEPAGVIHEHVDKVFQDGLNTDLFFGLSTRYHQLQYFKDKFGLLVYHSYFDCID